MKKTIVITWLFFLTVTVYAQKIGKPKIMVIPSDNWYMQNGYMKEYDNQGEIIKVPDYKRAFLENTQIKPVITSIGKAFEIRHFPLKRLETTINNIKESNAMNAARISNRTSSTSTSSPLDKIKEKAKPDIIIELSWHIIQEGPRKRIQFTLVGIDAATSKQIASAQGIGSPSISSPIEVLLEEAVNTHMDNFCLSLHNHFKDTQKNGREGIVEIRLWDDWDKDFFSEFGNENIELVELIENWFDDNSVQGQYSSDVGDRVMLMEGVRIPFFYERKGRKRAMTISKFAGNLRKYLKKYGIESKHEAHGLGKAIVLLGHK